MRYNSNFSQKQSCRHCILILTLLLPVVPTVLLCTMIKLLFSIVPCTWLCLGFDNTRLFLLLLSRAYTKLRPLQLLTPPLQQGGYECTSSCEGTELGSQVTKGMSQMIWHRAQHIKLGEVRESWGFWSDGVWHPREVLYVIEPCCPGGG